MPKLSKATAASHMRIPGTMESSYDQADGWTISISTYSVDVDRAFAYRGLPNDQCQATHMGYVLKGKMVIRAADGSEEVFEAGDAFFLEPGHTEVSFAGLEVVEFIPTEDMNRQFTVVTSNLRKYLEDHGIEVPPELQLPSQ